MSRWLRASGAWVAQSYPEMRPSCPNCRGELPSQQQWCAHCRVSVIARDLEKGPRLVPGLITEQRILPDLDVSWPGHGRFWVEVKTQSTTGYFKIRGRATHGIRETHRRDYMKVQEITGTPVMLYVLSLMRQDRTQSVIEPTILGARLDSLDGFLCERAHQHVPSCLFYFYRDGFRALPCPELIDVFV